jgi:hypothetical protein
VQSVDWLPTRECTLPDQETSERRPYAPQGATGRKLKKTTGVCHHGNIEHVLRLHDYSSLAHNGHNNCHVNSVA